MAAPNSLVAKSGRAVFPARCVQNLGGMLGVIAWNMQCDRLLTLSPFPGIAIFSNHFEPGPTKNRAIAALGAGQAIGYIVGLIGGQSPSLSARSHFRPPSHIAAPGALP